MWTDERVELLKKLWAEGHSASQIARQLGGVTRNAVIGKVHRLKLSARAKSTVTTKRVKKADGEDTAPRSKMSQSGGSSARVQPIAHGSAALNLDTMADAIAEAHVQISDDKDVVVPISRRLTLVQLGERTCKWPIGDPLKSDFHFCGNDSREGSPYCSYHSKLAFQPASERRRVR